jgi:DNA-binding protein H-NS
MSSLATLIAQREALDKQIAETRKQEISDAIKQVKALVAEYGLSASDVFPSSNGVKAMKAAATGRGKVAPKYRDPATGNTWTGRGRTPLWLAGHDKSKFLIG